MIYADATGQLVTYCRWEDDVWLILDLCAVVSIIRLGVVFPASGIASYPGGLTAAPIHVAGSVNLGDLRHYQCWYRSLPALCGANNYDLTQGVTIPWGF